MAGGALCDGGLMIDFSSMKGVHVDAVRRRALAQLVTLWAEEPGQLVPLELG